MPIAWPSFRTAVFFTTILSQLSKFHGNSLLQCLYISRHLFYDISALFNTLHWHLCSWCLPFSCCPHLIMFPLLVTQLCLYHCALIVSFTITCARNCVDLQCICNLWCMSDASMQQYSDECIVLVCCLLMYFFLLVKLNFRICSTPVLPVSAPLQSDSSWNGSLGKRTARVADYWIPSCR